MGESMVSGASKAEPELVAILAQRAPDRSPAVHAAILHRRHVAAIEDGDSRAAALAGMLAELLAERGPPGATRPPARGGEQRDPWRAAEGPTTRTTCSGSRAPWRSGRTAASMQGGG